MEKSSNGFSRWDPTDLQPRKELRSRPSDDKDREDLGRQQTPRPPECLEEWRRPPEDKGSCRSSASSKTAPKAGRVSWTSGEPRSGGHILIPPKEKIPPGESLVPTLLDQLWEFIEWMKHCSIFQRSQMKSFQSDSQLLASCHFTPTVSNPLSSVPNCCSLGRSSLTHCGRQKTKWVKKLNYRAFWEISFYGLVFINGGNPKTLVCDPFKWKFSYLRFNIVYFSVTHEWVHWFPQRLLETSHRHSHKNKRWQITETFFFFWWKKYEKQSWQRFSGTQQRTIALLGNKTDTIDDHFGGESFTIVKMHKVQPEYNQSNSDMQNKFGGKTQKRTFWLPYIAMTGIRLTKVRHHTAAAWLKPDVN